MVTQGLSFEYLTKELTALFPTSLFLSSWKSRFIDGTPRPPIVNTCINANGISITTVNR